MLRYLQVYQHRGRWRLRFRRKGYPGRELPVPRDYAGPDTPLPIDCLDLLAAYQAAMAEPVASLKPGEKRAGYGSVAWLVAEFLASLDYTRRPQSVRVKLFKGKGTVVGRKSEHSLYSKKLATYESGDSFDHDAAKGFIRLWGLGQQTQAQLQLLKGGKGFDLPGLMGPEKK